MIKKSFILFIWLIASSLASEIEIDVQLKVGDQYRHPLAERPKGRIEVVDPSIAKAQFKVEADKIFIEITALKRGTTEIWIRDGKDEGESKEFQYRFKIENGASLNQSFTFDVIFWAALLMIAIAVFIISNVIFTEEDKFKASETLDEVDARAPVKSSGVILKYSRPFFRRYLTPIVGNIRVKREKKVIYKQNIASAGLTHELSVEDFIAFKLFLILGFPILFIVLRWFLEEDWSMSIVPVVAVIGFFYPNIWIKGRIQKRQGEIIQTMPFIVDLLALSVEAGLDTIAAISRVIEKAPQGPLKGEFETLLREIKIGSSRTEALRNLAWRVNLIQVSSFCATLIAADSVGAPIGPILKASSDEMRQKRSSEIEKKGAKAATKLLFPMMVFIVPAVFIVVGAPLILESLNQ